MKEISNDMELMLSTISKEVNISKVRNVYGIDVANRIQVYREAIDLPCRDNTVMRR